MSGKRESNEDRRARFLDAGEWENFKRLRMKLADERRVDPRKVDAEAADEIYSRLDEAPPRPVARDKSATNGTYPDSKRPVARKADFVDKSKQSIRDAVDWVCENISISDLEPSDCPSATAWGLWDTYSRDPQSRRDFFQTFAAKLLPTRNQIEHEDKRRDDGRDLFGFIADNIASEESNSNPISASGPEDEDREPEVPGKDDSPGDDK